MTLTVDAERAWRAEMTARMAAAEPGLQTLRARPLPARTGLVLVSVRDAMAYLPHFLRHHRALGVQRFAFVDNGSVDGTLETLLAQPDCDVYRHRGDYMLASAGAVWRNLLMARHADAAWWLHVDVDECIAYPGWPALPLDAFAAAMRAAGRPVVNGIMLDMYGPGPILTTRPGADGDLLAACPMFDGEGYTVECPADWRGARFPRLNIRGGPEMRVIRPRPDFGWLAKSALVLAGGIVYREPHTVYPFELNFDVPRLALLHFRYFDHIATKLARLREHRYSPGSVAAYDVAAARLAAQPSLSFAYPGSVTLRSGEQLVAQGLVAA
jgi:hypothetical protein